MTARRRRFALALTAAVTASIVAVGCGSDGDAVPGFPDGSVPANVAAGADDYRVRCQSCHGTAGEGGPIGPAVDHAEMFDQLGVDGVRAVIADGAEGMPAYAGLMTDDEIDAVVAYLFALSERPDQG